MNAYADLPLGKKVQAVAVAFFAQTTCWLFMHDADPETGLGLTAVFICGSLLALSWWFALPLLFGRGVVFAVLAGIAWPIVTSLATVTFAFFAYYICIRWHVFLVCGALVGLATWCIFHGAATEPSRPG